MQTIEPPSAASDAAVLSCRAAIFERGVSLIHHLAVSEMTSAFIVVYVFPAIGGCKFSS